MDDALLSELARRAQRGDRMSFRFLVEGETRRLIALAYRYTGDWEASRDLTQETWIRVYQRLLSFDPARSFHSWLGAIHRNGCLSYLRRPSVARELPTSKEGLEFATVVAVKRADLTGDARDPLERVEQEEFRARLCKAMTRLSEKQLQVFTRVDLEQTPQTEAARALGMKPNTLRTTLHFARKRLARWLRNMEDESWAKT